MRASDPMQRMHIALETGGCQPRGPLQNLHAKCPAHNDASPSLSVREGADGRVLLHCFAGCDSRDIVALLGLTWADLFPVGHGNGPRAPKVIRHRGSEPSLAPAAALLTALHTIGGRWSGIVNSECPVCLHEHCWWRFGPSGVTVDCPEGCDQPAILRALDWQVREAEREVAA